MAWFRRREFGVYFVVGGIATLIDWSVYALCLRVLGDHRYLMAVMISIGLAGLFHYLANKHLTFQCRSRSIGTQIPVYMGVAVLGLGMSMGILRLLVGNAGLPPMAGRICTTMLMLVPNYLMHKYLTFNKKIFISE